MSQKDDDEEGEGSPLGDGAVYQIPDNLVETNMGLNTFKPDYIRETNIKIPRELVYLPGEPDRKNPQTSIFYKAFKHLVDEEIKKQRKKKKAEQFMQDDQYVIPDTLVYSNRLDGSPEDRKILRYEDTYKIPKNLIKTDQDDSILSAPMPVRRDLEDDYELPSRKKGSSISKVAMQFQKNQRGDIKRIKSIQSIDFESEHQGQNQNTLQNQEPNRKSRFQMPWDVFRRQSRRQNFMSADPFVEGKRQVKEKMQLRRMKSNPSLDSTDQAKTNVTKPAGGVKKDKLALLLANAKKIQKKKDAAEEAKKAEVKSDGGIKKDKLALFVPNANKIKYQQEASERKKAQLTYEEKLQEEKAQADKRMQRLVEQSEKLKAKQQYEALISKNIDPFVEKAKREVKLKMELQRAKSLERDDSLDKSSDIPGESAPIYEKKTSVFFKNKIDRYKTKDKRPDDFGQMSPVSQSRTSGNFFNSQEFTRRKRHQRENPSIIMEASREATMPTQGQEDIILEHKQRMISLDKAEKRIMMDLVQMDKKSEKLKMEQALKKSGGGASLKKSGGKSGKSQQQYSESGNMGMINQFHQNLIDEIDNPSADLSQVEDRASKVVIVEPTNIESPTLQIRGQDDINFHDDKEENSFNLTKMSEEQVRSPEEQRLFEYHQSMEKFKKERERLSSKNIMSGLQQRLQRFAKNSEQISSKRTSSAKNAAMSPRSPLNHSSKHSSRDAKPMNMQDDTHLKKRKETPQGITKSLNIQLDNFQRADDEQFEEFSKNSKKVTLSNIESHHSEEDQEDEQQNIEFVRPKAPPRPNAFVRWCNAQDGPTGANIFGDSSKYADEMDETSKLYEAMSYSKLLKNMMLYHPLEEETKKQFSFNTRCTVKDFESKLTDVCGCILVKKQLKRASKCLAKACLPRKTGGKRKIQAPDSIGMVPDSSDSSDESSEGDEDKGITKCSQSIGDGATLYIQMMYTFTIMFFFLTILNLPIYIIYEKSTAGNNLANLDEFFKYFTLGNLGQFTKKCGYSDFLYRFDENIEPPNEIISIDCGKGVIAKILNFGFMYSYDQEYGGMSEGNKQCDHVENPMKPYKWKPPEPLVCNEDVLGIVEMEICQIQKQEENGEISKEESLYLQCLITKQGVVDECAPVFASNFGDYIFVNNDQNADVYITNPDCDGQNYIWNYNGGESFKMTANFRTNPISNSQQVIGFTLTDPPETQGFSEMFTEVEVVYQEYDGKILGLQVYGNTLFQASEEDEINKKVLLLDQDKCEKEQDTEEEEEIDPLDLVNVLDTDMWSPSGEIPAIPNTDQFQTYANIDPECGFQNTSAVIRKSPLFQDRESQQLFLSYFDENCFEKQKCVLDPARMGYQMGDIKGSKPVNRQKTGLFGLISNECKYRMSNEAYQNITSQQYIGVFGCKFDDVMIPGQTETRVHKEIIGVVVVVADFLCMVIVIYFFTKLESLNNEFLENVDDLRVQMKDFGVIIENVILDKYTYDSRIIKMKVWLHFKKILEPKADKYNDLSCVDVTLSLYSQPSIQLVFRMQEIQLEINEIKTKLLLNEYKDSQIPNKQDRLRFLDQKRERFEKRYASLVQKVEHDSQTEAILTVQRVPKAQRLKEIQYIFVTFRGCETKGEVLKMYQRQSGPEAFVNYLNKSLRPNNFVDTTLFGKNILVKPIVEPDEIIWQNLAYNAKEQKLRASITQVISLFFIIFNMILTIFLTGVTIQMNRSIPDPIGCPDQPVPKQEAYEDYIKDHDEFQETKSIGLMACYCKEETSIFLPWTIIGHNFAEFSPDGDKTNICSQWQGLQIAKSVTLSIVGTAAVIINEFLAVFFKKMGEFQKKHTKMEEQINCFRQILVQEYINMGIITLITSFDKIGVTEMILGENAESFNVYDSFTPDWYMDYGKKICLYIFMSSFLINAKDLTEYFKKELIRLWDRNFKTNLKFDPEDEDCDLPNSRERVQVRLEQLYMGDVFKGEKNYSRMISTLFVILTYCSGMPIMYLNGFIFYLVTYCVNKFLILSFYQKSRTLTRSIPLFIAGTLKYGIIIHLAMSMLMLTNKEGFKTQTTHQGVPPIIDVDKQHQQMIEDGTLDAETALENNKIIRERFYFLHQQLYFAFLVIIVFSYLIGKNTKIIIRLILNAFIKGFLAVFNSAKKFCSVKSEVVSIKLKQKIQEQKERLEEEIQKRVEIEIKTKEQKQQEKIQRRQQEALKREQEQMDYEMRKVQEFEACSGPVEVNRVLQKHLNEDEERELQEQERIEKEREEDEQDNIQSIDIDEDKNNEEIERIAQEKEAQELKEREEEEAKRVAIEQLTKRFERPDYSDDIYIELSTESLSNFYQRANRELADFWEIFQYNQQIPEDLLEPDNQSPYKDLFLETCYTYRISVDDAFTYQKFLLDRIKDLEIVIDRYMNLLKTTLVEKMKNGFEKDRRKRKLENKEGSLKDQVAQTKYEEWFLKYSDQVQFDDLKYYPYSKKLKILIQFQEELIAADCNRKDNKLGVQDICRMTGSLTQSYFIFDAQEYKVARRIYYNLDKNEVSESEAQESEAPEDEQDKEQDARSQQSAKTKKSTKTKHNFSSKPKVKERKKSNKSNNKTPMESEKDQEQGPGSAAQSIGRIGANKNMLRRSKTMAVN